MSYEPPVSKTAWLVLALVGGACAAMLIWGTLRSSPSTPADGPSLAGQDAHVAALPTSPAALNAPSQKSGQPAGISRLPKPPTRVVASPAAPANGPLRPAAERRELAALERDNAELRRRLEEMLNWIVENVKDRYPLPEAQMKNLRIVPVDKDLLTSQDLVEVLRLTPAEVDRLDDSFLATRSILYEIEASTLVTDPLSGPGRLLLHTPAYTEEGAEVSAILYEELLATLGKARFDRFMQIASGELAKEFDYFGARDRTLDFQLLVDDNGDASLFIRDETAISDPVDPMVQHITATEQIVDALPEAYAPYADRLPALLAPFAE